MKPQFSILPIDELRIVKQIFIVSEIPNGDISIGYILYERRFESNYRFKEKKEEDRKSVV